MQYRTRLEVIEAVQWLGANHLITETFMKNSGAYISHDNSIIGQIIIPSEGSTVVSWGDWVLKDSDGVFSACTAADFAARYEPTDDTPTVTISQREYDALRRADTFLRRASFE